MIKNKAERRDTVGNISVGMVAYFFRTNVPNGWLILDGSSNLLKTDFPELWAFAQTAILEGVTGFSDVDADYFGIPDARGSFIRGVDNGKGLDPDGTRTIGHQQIDAMQRISGSINLVYMQNNSSPSGVLSSSSMVSSNRGLGNNEAHNIRFDSANSTSPSVAKTNDLETRPVNLALLPCIRYET